MLEKSLEDIQFEATATLAPILTKELKDIYKLNIPIDSAYNVIITIYKSIPVKSILGIDIDILLEDLKCTVMLYSCYFAMDYIIKKENSSDNKLNSTFIQQYYDCDSMISQEVTNNIRANIDKLSKTLSYPDPGRVNPYIGKEYENNTKGHNHIYNGNILLFLNRNIQFEQKKIYIKLPSPSVIFVSLKILGYLPNGGNTNKGKEEIKLTTIKVINAAINGGTIFANKEEGKPYITVQKNYYTKELMKKIQNLSIRRYLMIYLKLNV